MSARACLAVVLLPLSLFYYEVSGRFDRVEDLRLDVVLCFSAPIFTDFHRFSGLKLIETPISMVEIFKIWLGS